MIALRVIRESLGLTQAELAGAVGISQSALSNYENGLRIPPRRAKLILRYFIERGAPVNPATDLQEDWSEQKAGYFYYETCNTVGSEGNNREGDTN